MRLQDALDDAVIANDPVGIVELVNCGADVNFCRANLASPINAAARAGDYDAFHRLLRSGVEWGGTAGDSETPLFLAARHGDHDTVLTLLALGADLEHHNIRGETPLYHAAAFCEIECVPGSGEPPELSTSYHANWPAFELLLSRGANLHHPDNLWGNLLLHAIAHRQTAMASRIIELGISPAISGRGGNLLSAAVYSGSVACLEYCLQFGLKLNNYGADGFSPLHLAADENLEMLRHLLAQGADPLHRHEGTDAGLLHADAIWSDPGLVEQLITAGVSVRHACKRGLTPLFHAVMAASAPGIELLHSHGGDFNHEDHEGKNASFYARNHRSLARLAEFGTELNRLDHLGRNLLHAHAGNRDIVNYLLSQGLDANHADKLGNTPLFFAQHPDVMNHLIQHGANPHHRNRHGRQFWER